MLATCFIFRKGEWKLVYSLLRVLRIKSILKQPEPWLLQKALESSMVLPAFNPGGKGWEKQADLRKFKPIPVYLVSSRSARTTY